MRFRNACSNGVCGISTVAVAGLLAVGISFTAAVGSDQIELGRQLFEHKWVANDPLCPDGDGLGPLHNADSCVACHNLGATGGAGTAEHNVALMTLGLSDGGRISRKAAAQEAKARKMNPAFAPGPRAVSTAMLHQFGTDPRYEALAAFHPGTQATGSLGFQESRRRAAGRCRNAIGWSLRPQPDEGSRPSDAIQQSQYNPPVWRGSD